MQTRGAAASTSGAALAAYHPNAHGGLLNRVQRATLQPTANNMQRLEARVNTGSVAIRCGYFQLAIHRTSQLVGAALMD